MKCEMCYLDDEMVLVKHHIDSTHTIIVCANCHMKIHKRNFRQSPKEVNIKSELFNDIRLNQILSDISERDRKVKEYLNSTWGL